MELLGIAQVAGVQTGLDVLDVVDVLLGVGAEVVDVEFLQADDAVDLVDEVLPFGVLVAHDALDQVRKGLSFLPSFTMPSRGR